jgi:hypothetical protein
MIIKNPMATTMSGFFDSGHFETGDWLVPSNLTGTSVDVCALFEAIGRYKSTSACTSFAVTAGEDCWIPGFTPFSCLLTAKTGKTIAIIGGVVIGGYLIFNLIKK